ncbi:partitioning defective 3 homolog isoform X4 [Homalodisca vitripennis]|uniref:partitioning defective 3 homolog isoform X4 n=1 Tax=Homalodisca vitripennis TaxID=197043 RepID=UPI001EEBEE23|nr:partitioning defective 3 homolog isoform X4 [Homalodisca vitripennis]
MLDQCQKPCGKLAQIFGWRHKYDVQRLQRANQVPPSKCVVITQVVSRKRSADSWVAVHSLQSQSDGGILDPDDRLQDVADDREQIIANFEDGEPPVHHGGDGASGSSVGTPSPDIFQGPDKYRTDIEVTNEQIASGAAPLQVRRGSEPALNQLLPSTGTSNGHLPAVSETSKRWSAAPIIAEPRDRVVPAGRKEERERGVNGHSTERERERWGDEREESPHRLSTGFTRDGCRLSMQYLGDAPGGMKWMDAADRAVNSRVQSLSLPRETRRKEPLGQATSSPTENYRNESTQYIVLDTESGALGIHVVPDYDSQGQDRGLLVQGIEPGGRVDRDGRLAVYDRIIEINGHNLLDQPFNVVQDIFRDSLRSPELRLRVVKHKAGMKKPPPPVYPKPPPLHERDAMAMVEGEERSVSTTTKVATVSPTKKLPSTHPGTNTLQLANTRKIGRKMELDLVKGPHGLGFSITTRDNPAGGNCPIYIKNILPKGAAVEDGRLRPGDRLLAVDGVELTGKSQSEAVALLRNVPPAGKVRIVVSRQDDSTSPKNVDSGPESLNSSASSGIKPLEKDVNTPPPHQSQSSDPAQLNESGLYPWRQREVLTFDIPVHDSEKAGLGVSVKGKTSANQNANPNSSNGSAIDLGIFVKNVIHGGAASRDGRLRTNDQLLNVNGVSLLGLSNSAAMETLRKAMIRSDGPAPGCITLTVARRVPELTSPGSGQGLAHKRRDSLSSLLTDSSGHTETFGGPGETYVTPDNSGASENSDNTVIFLPPYKQQHNHLDGVGMRNPVLERLTGQTQGQGGGLRNESYYRATHHTTMLLNNSSKLGSPTVNQPSGETVIIEEDSPYIPATGRRVEVETVSSTPQRGSTSSTQTADATYASQLSLEEVAGFSRDAFGRQSMSEKRHATLDAKNTDTYQRNKKLREEREKQRREEMLKHGKHVREGASAGMIRVNSAESIPRSDTNGEAVVKSQLGPSLGMKKSSSLESLQTMVQEIQMQEDVGTYRNTQGAIRVIRGRGCNESFRAAVDRSYEAPLSLHELRMDTLAEDETEGVLGTRQSSLNTAMDCKMIKVNKKKPGLLKGIGSMFRFGKHRKSMEGGPQSLGGEEEREAARRAAREEQERIQEQYKRLMQKQAEMQQQSRGEQSNDNTLSSNGSSGGGGGSEPTRTERIQQLRAQHQRRHVERRGQYPLDEREERYEEAIRQRINVSPPSYYKTVQDQYYKRLEAPEFDPSAMTRPGSRVGITDPARFSHYVNYQEIQQHLNAERDKVRLRRPAPPPPTTSVTDSSAQDPTDSRRQQHYHSQRRDPREQAHRPVSNFYEYESVQAVLRDGNCNSLPRRNEIAPTHGMSSSQRSSGYGQPPRLYQPFLNHPPAYHINNNNNNNSKPQLMMQGQRKPHGPFVTHVTIREAQSTSPKV